MNKDLDIAVLTHNPQGEWGDVRPLIEKQGYYEKWGKSLNLEIGQTVLIYISSNIRRIEYIMEVIKVHDDSLDLKLMKKLDAKQAELLAYNHLKEHGLKQGTINYLLNKNPKLYDYVFKVLNDNFTTALRTKNIILYGAPGVGKTHNYKNLISMIEEGKGESEIFETISNNLHVSLENETFQKIKDEKRVEFVTFHQSYSYEDFIEGYRPDEDSDKIVRKDGIFKIIADEARKNLEDSSKSTNEFIEEKKISEIFKEFCAYVSDEIIDKSKFNINDTAYIYEVENDAFRYKGDNWNAHENGLRMKFSDILEFYSKNIQERKEIKDLGNISRLSIQHATYYFKVYELFKKFKANAKQVASVVIENAQKNFYIVIDEINRGNISKIFGELITLIEEDKRDKYEITLPYSKKPFKVPSNLYIIATMNSTDKSIATIDIALRRRFTFLKMKPNLELVTNPEAKEFMKKLNRYIADKRGEDYILGHSYFMGDIDLEFVKEYKIKPLLEEYFYADEKSPDEIIEQALKEYKKEIDE